MSCLLITRFPIQEEITWKGAIICRLPTQQPTSFQSLSSRWLWTLPSQLPRIVRSGTTYLGAFPSLKKPWRQWCRSGDSLVWPGKFLDWEGVEQTDKQKLQTYWHTCNSPSEFFFKLIFWSALIKLSRLRRVSNPWWNDCARGGKPTGMEEELYFILFIQPLLKAWSWSQTELGF